jgi:hypothetical protein
LWDRTRKFIQTFYTGLWVDIGYAEYWCSSRCLTDWSSDSVNGILKLPPFTLQMAKWDCKRL